MNKLLDFSFRHKVLSVVVVSVVCIILGVVEGTVDAQTTPQFNRTQYRSAFAKEQVTVSTISKALTAATYNPTVTNADRLTTRAEFADIECDTHAVRVWLTGSAPTASQGILFSTGTLYTIQGYHDISNFHAISADGSDATCNVQYYRFSSNNGS